jgi:putative FmdB family regulatory protein
MALYEYKCADCDERFDLMRPMSRADEPAPCPDCGGSESYRMISNFSSITPGASAAGSTNPVMDARIKSGGGGGGCCGGSCCG